MYFSEILNRAVEFASIAHKRQMRKSPEAQIPYVQHSFMVGLILQRAGFTENVVAAGILHDCIEDTRASVKQLTDLFGSEIAELVNSVSEQDRSLPWEERKELYLRHLEVASDEAKAIAAADKIHNIHSITLSLERGADIWSAFKRGREAQLDRFRRLLECLRSNWDHPLLDELEQALETLEGLV